MPDQSQAISALFDTLAQVANDLSFAIGDLTVKLKQANDEAEDDQANFLNGVLISLESANRLIVDSSAQTERLASEETNRLLVTQTLPKRFPVYNATIDGKVFYFYPEDFSCKTKSGTRIYLKQLKSIASKSYTEEDVEMANIKSGQENLKRFASNFFETDRPPPNKSEPLQLGEVIDLETTKGE